MDTVFETENRELLDDVRAAEASREGTGKGPNSAACKVAKRNLDHQQKWVDRYNVLVFVVAAAVTISVIVLIVMLLLGKEAGAISGAIGTVVTGTAMGFVLKQRKDARDQLAMLMKQRDEYCRV